MDNKIELIQQTNDNKRKATASFILGICSIPAFLLPIIGLPVSSIGLIMGIKGRRSSNKDKAVIGIVLSSVGLILSIANAALGAYLAIKGVHPWIQK